MERKSKDVDLKAVRASLKYPAHFWIFAILMAALSAALAYFLLDVGQKYRASIHFDFWPALVVQGLAYLYVLYMTFISSYEIHVADDAIVVARPWKSSRIVALTSIFQTYAFTSNLTVVRTSTGYLFPIAALTTAGRQAKQEIEGMIGRAP